MKHVIKLKDLNELNNLEIIIDDIRASIIPRCIEGRFNGSAHTLTAEFVGEAYNLEKKCEHEFKYYGYIDINDEALMIARCCEKCDEENDVVVGKDDLYRSEHLEKIFNFYKDGQE